MIKKNSGPFEGMGCVRHLCLHTRSRRLLGVFVDPYFHSHAARESRGAKSYAGQF